MTTLNRLAENLAFVFGQQFNDTLNQSIKDDVIDYRALFIRQDLEVNFVSSQHYYQSFCVEMITTDASECGLKTGNTILVSKEELPKTVRLKNGKNYSFVGSVDRFKQYTSSSKQTNKYRKALPFQKQDVIYYTIQNNRLYLLNTVRPCKVLLEGIIEDPRDIQDCNYPTVFKDNIPFACPADMIARIKETIKRKYFPQLIEDGKEINIATNGND